MPYAVGLRLLAAFCYLTLIGIPFGVFFHHKARQKEKEKKRELELMEQYADGGK